MPAGWTAEAPDMSTANSLLCGIKDDTFLNFDNSSLFYFKQLTQGILEFYYPWYFVKKTCNKTCVKQISTE